MTDQDLTAPEAVERFHASEFSAYMILSARGDYVRYEDYAALSAALEAERAGVAPDDVAEFLERAEIARNELEDEGHYNAATILNEAAALVNAQWRENFRLQRRLETAHNAVQSIEKDELSARARAEAAEAKLKEAVKRMEEVAHMGYDMPSTFAGTEGEWYSRRANLMQGIARAFLATLDQPT